MVEKIIADCGGTKVSWRGICTDGTVKSLETGGINVAVMDAESVIAILKDELVPAFGNDASEIYFYAAGMVGGEETTKAREYFKSVFPNATLEAASDMLGAARALCGHNPGIACIMGTGSNSCFFDGNVIAKQARAGGYILGDEGGGAYLGIHLLSDYIKGMMPADVSAAFTERYGLDYLAIVKKVYREPMPNKFLGSFAPYIAEHRNEPYYKNLLMSAFTAFITRNITSYGKYPVHFVGSIAYYFKDELAEAVKAAGFELGNIVAGPIDKLVDYHR